MGDRETNTHEQASGQSSRPLRLPYRSPVLIEYGSVSKLTEGAVGSHPDLGAPTGKMCL
jgi:hypothetical protein